MSIATLEKNFSRMGARVKVGPPGRFERRDFSINIRRDEEGEFFDIQVASEIDMMILDVQKTDRHLLLGVKESKNQFSKFLCGHDERSWFTCAIPESSGASSVFDAKQALKPRELQEIEKIGGLKRKNSQKRHRKLKTGIKIHRQGEFMFVLEPNFNPVNKFPNVIHRNEPLSRNTRSKPHMAEYAYRTNGETLYISDYSEKTKGGISTAEYQELLRKDPDAKKFRWQNRAIADAVYVKGRVTHRDHKTLDLKDQWYRVMINTEGQSRAAANVKFVD